MVYALLTRHPVSFLQCTVFLCSRLWYWAASSFILRWLWNRQTHTHLNSSCVLHLLTACKSLHISGAPCLIRDEAGRASSWDQLPCSRVSQWWHHLSCYAKHPSLWGTWCWPSRYCQHSATEPALSLDSDCHLMALHKELIFVTQLGLFHRRYYRGVRLVG